MTTRKPLGVTSTPASTLPFESTSIRSWTGIREAGQVREKDETKLQSGPSFALFEEGVG